VPHIRIHRPEEYDSSVTAKLLSHTPKPHHPTPTTVRRDIGPRIRLAPIFTGVYDLSQLRPASRWPSFFLAIVVPARRNVRAQQGARAGNRLDATRTDALLPQPETGKISCVRLPRCGRLPPGVRRHQCTDAHWVQRVSHSALKFIATPLMQ
jgi:hypothetical protein